MLIRKFLTTKNTHSKALRIFMSLHKMLYFSASVPIILVVRLIRPFILLRFGPFRSDVIGHMVFYLEYYLSEREMTGSKTFDCFYFQTSVHPNEQWTLMTKRFIRVSPIFYYLDRINNLIPGGDVHSIHPVFDDRDGILARTSAHVKFIEEEDCRGKLYLTKLGLSSYDKFVCFIIRDSIYKEEYQNLSNDDWSYHNYRDSDSDNYKESAIALAKKGYWVFRMGKGVKKSFDVNHPKIIDYALSEYRTDFLDVWLMANCHFCVSTGSGIDAVACVFRKPIMMINYIPLSNIVSFLPVITVPKKLVWKKNQRELTLSEHLIHNYTSSELYRDEGIEIYDRESNEICEAVMEMEMSLAGGVVDQSIDNHFQNLFWDQLISFRKDNNCSEWIHPNARIGSNFIRKNQEWFFK